MIDVLFPRHCLQCALPLTRQRLPICPLCLFSIQRVDIKSVRSHLDSFIQDIAPNLAFHLEYSLFALWYFDQRGVVQRIHQALKYENRPQYGVELGSVMGIAYQQEARVSLDVDVVIPVPLARSRFLERGYNQSEMLARGITRVIARPLRLDILHRRRSTRSQTGLTKNRRWQNVFTAFDVRHREHIKDKRILLIDDILTTGATLIAAAHPLHTAGASSVSFATLAFTRS